MKCQICDAELPRRRWWQISQLLLAPPPLCRGAEIMECQRRFARKIGVKPW